METVTRLPIVDRRIRFALVGCGRISKNHLAALVEHSERAEIVALCDSKGTGGGVFRAGHPDRRHDPKPMNQQPGCEALCCPESTRAAQRVMSLPMSVHLAPEQQDRVRASLVRAVA